MTVNDAISHICKRHRFESPEKYSIFLPLDDTTTPDEGEDEPLILTHKTILIHKHHSQTAKHKNRPVIVEEEGRMGRWLPNEHEMWAYPTVESTVVELRKKPDYVFILFQNGEWVADIKFREEMTLSALLSLSLYIKKKIHEYEVDGEVSFFFFFLLILYSLIFSF
jgi:hypothetical protein